MSRPCRDRAGDIAALALGALEPDEATAVQAHVDGCPACAATLREHQVLVGLIDDVDPDRLDSGHAAPSGLDRRVVAAVERERHRQRRRTLTTRWMLAAAAVVLVVAGVAGGISLAGRDSQADGFVLALSATENGDPQPVGTATIQPRPWGSAIDLVIDGSTTGRVYRVWLAAADGTRTPAGTFTGQEHRLTVSLASALETSRAATLGISTDTSDPLLEVPLPRAGFSHNAAAP